MVGDGINNCIQLPSLKLEYLNAISQLSHMVKIMHLSNLYMLLAQSRIFCPKGLFTPHSQHSHTCG